MSDLMRQIQQGRRERAQQERAEQEAAQQRRREFEEKAKQAGYYNLHLKKHPFGLDSPVFGHGSCGLVVSEPEIHDPLCPANGRGRTDPLLSEV